MELVVAVPAVAAVAFVAVLVVSVAVSVAAAGGGGVLAVEGRKCRRPRQAPWERGQWRPQQSRDLGCS